MVAERRAASDLQARLRSGQFVITANNADELFAQAALHGGFSAFNGDLKVDVVPAPGAALLGVIGLYGVIAYLVSLRTREISIRIALGLAPIAAARMILRQGGAIVALGAAVLVLGGDDPKAGDQPEAKAVYDLDSRGLLAMAQAMRSSNALPTGTKIDGGMRVVLGAADVPLDPPAAWQPNSLKQKIAAGADFVQTQFCMDLGVVRRYVARLAQCGVQIPILIGVAPIPSARSARWMREKLFGTIIPESHIVRLENATDPKREGRTICIEVLRELAEIPGVAGAHVMAPMNFTEIPAVITESGVAGRKLAHGVH